MNNAMRYGLQAINYTLFMAIVWYFSFQPPYRQLEEGQAVVTLSFAHAAELREPCRRFTQEELQKLPPNMRRPMDCARERSPIQVELYLDSKLMAKHDIEAPGLHNDQGIDLFHRIKAPAGDHNLRIWMNDDVKVEGPTYQFEQAVTLKPEQQLLIDFDANSGGFYID
jgi:hypothetical protein